MIYLIVCIAFSIMAMIFALEMLIKNKLKTSDDKEGKKIIINSFIHCLNSAAILILAWQCLKGLV